MDAYPGVTGEVVVTVRLSGATPDARVSIVRDQTIVAEQTFELDYEISEPNGHRCGPTCHFADVAMTVAPL